jgi:hypothetical protein
MMPGLTAEGMLNFVIAYPWRPDDVARSGSFVLSRDCYPLAVIIPLFLVGNSLTDAGHRVDGSVNLVRLARELLQ